MINKQQMCLMAQIINGMEEIIMRLEEAYRNKNAEELKQYKKLMLEFHEKLSGELGG